LEDINGKEMPTMRESIDMGDFTLDHLKPFSKGGRTQLKNAALMDRSCNAAKGNRRG